MNPEPLYPEPRARHSERTVGLRGAKTRRHDNMNKTQLDKILADHASWLRNPETGTRADLSGAVLSKADLSGADLSGAVLSKADLSGAALPGFQIPQTGTLEVWKKLANGSLAKLLVLADSPRTGTPIGRKCRAKSVLVLEGEGASRHDPDFRYTPGATLTVENYDPDIRIECAPGIHFFLTREEAEAY